MDESPVTALRVMSYNVHRCVGRDRRCAPERIAEVICGFEPDVVGLQEVDSGYHIVSDVDQVEHLAGLTGMHAVPGPAKKRHTGSYGNVLLTRHTVTAIRHFDLSVASREPRAALDVDLSIGPFSMRCIVTHFGLGLRERQMQITALCRLIDQVERPLTVLLGDFNEWVPRRPSLGLLNARFGPSYAPLTFPSRRPVLRLDRMWVKPRHAVTQLWPLRNHLTRIASDHLPLCAVVQIDAQ